MKKIIVLLTVLALLVGATAFTVSADNAGAEVFVTLSDSTGKIVLAQEKITVQDKNGDGKYDVDEVFFAAHEAKYNGGAAAGYATASGTWGLYVTKLWGDTSGNFGYYINNQMAMGLTDEVKAGDYVDAFVYQIYEYNPTTYETTADTYCFFDKHTVSVTEGESVTVVLKDVEFDASFAPVNVAVSNAVILIDGEETSYKTDADGKVTFTVNKTGELLVSAKKDGTVLVPPVLKVTSAAKPALQTPTQQESNANQEKAEKTESPKTGDQTSAIPVLLCVSGLVFAFLGKKVYEA